MLMMTVTTTISTTGQIQTPDSQPSPLNRTILYVGGTGPANYTSIQRAINDAHAGDTVFVYDDSAPYKENIIISKSLQLIGESQKRTIIDGKKHDDVIHITSDQVTIKKFTIINSGTGGNWDDAGIDIRSCRNVIEENTITGDWHGIHLEYNAEYNTIRRNSIVANGYFGIHINSNTYYHKGASHNLFIGNEVCKNAVDGICCFYGYAQDNSFIQNTIMDNDRYGIGLKDSCTGNEFTENTFKDNTYGIELYGGSSENKITENKFINDCGIGIHSASLNNSISENTFDNSSLEIGSPFVIIVKNEFKTKGIIFSGFQDLSLWNTHTIKDNIVDGRPVRYYKNTDHKIIPEDTSQVILANCTKCTIQNLKANMVDTGIQLGFSKNNTITGNTADKIRLQFSPGNTITENTITSDCWSYGWEDGIYLRYSPQAHITGNHLEDGGFIEIYDSSNNEITENTVRNGGTIRLYWDSHMSLIANNTISNNPEGLGIYLQGPINTSIIGNSISFTDQGISLHSTHGNYIYRNNIYNNTWGIHQHDSNDNYILENNIFNTSYRGLHLFGSNNHIFHNNFFNNQEHAYGGNSNQLDDGYPAGGNYWDDYNGTDLFQGPSQNISGSDGIGDTPYPISGGNDQDRYPLMNPVDLFPPRIEFQTNKRQLTVPLGDGIGGPNDERLDVWVSDDTTIPQNITVTLYVKGLGERTWSLIKPMPYIRELHRGNISAEEITAYYDNGYHILLYRVTAVDEHGNTGQRPSQQEDPLSYTITIQ